MNAKQFQPSPGFKGLWVPACVLFDLEIPLIQKVILAEVYQLQQNDDRECFAGNAHFCAITGCKERNLRNHLSALEKAGLLERYTPVKGRKMAVSRALEDAIEEGSQTPISLSLRQQNAAPQSSQESRNRQSSTRRAAKDDQGAAPQCHPKRQSVATENTTREQHEKTSENTTALGSDSRFDASTHHFDARGEPIVSKEAWRNWRRMLRVTHDEDGSTSKRQLQILARMVKLGFDGEALIRECTARRSCSFWEVPPDSLIPAHLAQRDSFHRDT